MGKRDVISYSYEESPNKVVISPQESEANLHARDLAALGDAGRLELEAEYAKSVAAIAIERAHVARMLNSHAWLRAQAGAPAPKSRWLPVLVLLLFVMNAAAILAALRPTLFPEARPAVLEPLTVAPRVQGRAVARK